MSSVKVAELMTPAGMCWLLAVPAALVLGVALGTVNPLYAGAVAGVLVVGLILLLRLDALVVTLVIAAHILVDSYLGFAVYQLALLLALTLLLVCAFGRSAQRPWRRPRWVWLWLLFLLLTLFPMLKGGAFSLTNAIGYYLEVVFSPFIMFWLGNLLARDISGVRRVFQGLSLLAALFAIHTIIEATTGKFLFESARAQADLLQASNYQIGAGVSRAGSFFGNPNGNGIFQATCFFLPLGLFLDSQRFWARMSYLVQMVLILLALMFTYSNGSWIATLMSLLAFLVLAGRLRYSVLLLLVMAGLAVVVLSVFPSQVATQIAHARDQSDLSLHLATWQTALRVMVAYPLFGVGLGSQAYLVLSHPYMVPAQTKPLAEPDNSYLQWGAIAGIPVMLLFLLLLALVFWGAWRNWVAVEIRHRALVAGGIAALLALSVNSLTVDGWTSPIDVQFLGWLIAGVVASPLLGRWLCSPSASSVERMAEVEHIQVGASWMAEARQGWK